MSEEKDWVPLDLSGGDDEEKKVTFEIEGEEDNKAPEILVEADNEQEDVEEDAESGSESAQKSAAKTEEEKALEGIETSGAQKRIRQLVKQRKEREAEIEALKSKVAEMQSKMYQSQEQLSASLKTNIDGTESAINSQIAQAKETLRLAAESGDIDRQLEAQETLAQANARKIQLESQKQAWENYAKNAQEQFEAQKQQSSEETAPSYPQAAKEWAFKNAWFGTDQIATAAALEINQEVLQEDFDPEDPEFYEEITRRLQDKYPERFKKVATEEDTTPVKQSTTKAAQVVAGASRTPKTQSNSVKLSKSDVLLAEKMGVPLEQYAIEKLRAEAADGEYLEIQ